MTEPSMAANEDFGALPGGEGKVNATKRYRVYERWQGNEKFFLWGYLVAGPNWRASLGTAFLLLAPTGIFLGFVAPYLTREVHAVIMVFSCLLPALSALFLFLTACRDPGIIPRQEPDEEYLQGRKPRTKDVFVNSQKVVIRYNDTCHFYQPPRAHHCSVNDNCIERFDHHCPWVGTTIGKRNYRSFLLFVYTTTVLCLYVFGCCLAQLFVKHRQLVNDAHDAGRSGDGLWGRTIGHVVPAIVLMAYTFLFFWFVGGLSGFHCYLVGTNQTTYENFRYNHDDRPNPYDKGLLGNCAEVWCSPIPPSQVAFRAYIDDVGPGGGTLAAQPPYIQSVESVGGDSSTVGQGQSSSQQDGYSETVQAQQALPSTQQGYHGGMGGMGVVLGSMGGAGVKTDGSGHTQWLQQGKQQGLGGGGGFGSPQAGYDDGYGGAAPAPGGPAAWQGLQQQYNDHDVPQQYDDSVPQQYAADAASVQQYVAQQQYAAQQQQYALQQQQYNNGMQRQYSGAMPSSSSGVQLTHAPSAASTVYNTPPCSSPQSQLPNVYGSGGGGALVRGPGPA